jgi:hypothetical protein
MNFGSIQQRASSRQDTDSRPSLEEARDGQVKYAIKPIQEKSHSVDSSVRNKSAKSRNQRPLRGLEHNMVLLQRKFSAAGQGERSKNPKSASLNKPKSEVQPGLDESLNAAFSKISIKPPTPAEAIIGDSDSDDTLDRIKFWTTPRARDKGRSGVKDNKELAKTPRGKRAEHRDIRNVKQIFSESIAKPREPQETSTRDYALHISSRPASSHSGDPFAMLTL